MVLKGNQNDIDNITLSADWCIQLWLLEIYCIPNMSKGMESVHDLYYLIQHKLLDEKSFAWKNNGHQISTDKLVINFLQSPIPF